MPLWPAWLSGSFSVRGLQAEAICPCQGHSTAPHEINSHFTVGEEGELEMWLCALMGQSSQRLLQNVLHWGLRTSQAALNFLSGIREKGKCKTEMLLQQFLSEDMSAWLSGGRGSLVLDAWLFMTVFVYALEKQPPKCQKLHLDLQLSDFNMELLISTVCSRCVEKSLFTSGYS
jgi:hypothetical protein